MKSFQFSVFSFQFPVAAFLLFMPFFVSAATAVVEVNTGAEEINALEGTLILPESMSVNRIESGNSVITLWVEDPNQNGNVITFAGITPGGFSGVRPVFALFGTFTTEDIKAAKFESVTALKNNGIGDSAPVSLSISIAPFRADTEVPENFTPIIASDPNVFGGKYFLVFESADKGSGVSHYQLKESRFPYLTFLFPSRLVESPTELRDQDLKSHLIVTAVDKNGSERVVKVLPTNPLSPRDYWPVAVIIILSLALLLFGVRTIWKRS